MPDQHLDRQAALHLEGGIDALARPFQHGGRNVGGRRSRPASPPAWENVLQHHGQRIGLLAGRAGGAPDPQGCVCAARRSIRPGRTVLRKASKGWLSRKNDVSLVVMASTTRSPISASLRLRAASRRPARRRPASLCSRTMGDSRVSSRYVLSGVMIRPERSLSRRRDKGEIGAVHARGSLETARPDAGDPGQRQHGGAEAGIGDGARHAPDHAGGFVLGDDRRAGRGDVARAVAAVAAHAGQHHGAAVRRRKAGRRCGTADRRTGGRNSPAALWDSRAIRLCRSRASSKMKVAGRQIDACRAGSSMPCTASAHGRPLARADMLCQHGGEGRRHVLGDHDRALSTDARQSARAGSAAPAVRRSNCRWR